MGPQAIPQKLHYRVGEVAEIVGVKPQLLLYWEAEFGFLTSREGEGEERLYTPADLQKVLTIKRLLHDEKLKMAIAKKKFRDDKAKPKGVGGGEERQRLLRQIRSQLKGLLHLLGDGS